MPKYTSVLGLEGRERKKRSAGPWLIFLGLLIASPLLYEGGRVVVANWYSVLGSPYEVPTPVFDQVALAWRSVSDAVRYRLAAQFNFGRWSPAMAVPVIFAMALFGSLILKRDR
jgi:hypothetical protein